MWRAIYILLGSIRFISAFAIFAFPLATALFQLVLDDIDGFAAYKSKLTWRLYGLYDKILDYFWYILILIYTTRLEIFGVFLALFLIRSVGQIIFIVTRKEIFLFLFPNIFEVYFLFYLVASNYITTLGFLFENPNLKYSISVITIIALIREYFVHIKRAKLSYYNWGEWPKSGDLKFAEGLFKKLEKISLEIRKASIIWMSRL